MSKLLCSENISAFCMSMHIAVKSGVSVIESIELSIDDSIIARSVAQTIMKDLDTGSTLSSALTGSGVFPDYMCDMVGTGEKTGKLDEVFLSLSRYYERLSEINRSVRNAVMYPAMLLTSLIIVFLLFSVLLMPIFADVYRQLGTGLPGSANAILKFGQFITSNWIVCLIAVSVIVVVIIVFRNRIMIYIRAVALRGSLGRMMACAKISNVLTLTLSSGMTVNQSLLMSARILEYSQMRRKIEEASQLAETGTALSSCVSNLGLFPKMYTKMLEIGERTGAIADTLEEISRMSGISAADKLDSTIAKIEPLLVVIMSVFVGALLISVMMPLTGVLSLL